MLLRTLERSKFYGKRLFHQHARKLSAAMLGQQTPLIYKENINQNTKKTWFVQKNCYSSEQVENEPIGEENNEQQFNEDDVRNLILQNAISYVQEFGWSHEAIVKGAEDAGYSIALAGMFDDSKSALVLYFVKQCNDKLLTYLIEQSSNITAEEKTSTTEFIKTAIKYRLNMLVPYMDHWGEAMATLIQPQNLFSSTQELARMVDDIWHYAGDKSADFNWYTKRGLLSKLYLSTQAVMITDKSSDFEDTWKFVDRRFEDVKTMMKATKTINSQLEVLGDASFAAFTVLQNISGLNTYKR